ncbi:MAG TPA: class I SAM-dependent methyltransferase [Gemmataceae bacterium]|nr:class I SAM-dependent methyltransferase [Gemmataceae bacterium]
MAVAPRQVTAASADPVSKSTTLARFLTLLCARPAAEVVDLGPVVGTNITFLGDRVGCKIHVADLYADLDRHARQDTLDQIAVFLGSRFPQRDESIDAILCWDVFDYLDPAAAGVLAGESMRMLRPEGLLLAFFGGGGSSDLRYTRYSIVDEAHIRHAFYPGACPRRRVLQNRDIGNLFAGLTVLDSILLKSGVREVLFQKPAY